MNRRLAFWESNRVLGVTLLLLVAFSSLVSGLCAAENKVLLPQITPSVQQPNRAASEDFVFINATPFLLNVQFSTPQNVLVTQPVQPNNSYVVRRKTASVAVYAREGDKPTPITPDMIVNGTVSVKFEPQQAAQPAMPAMPAPQPTAPQQIQSPTPPVGQTPAPAPAQGPVPPQAGTPPPPSTGR